MDVNGTYSSTHCVQVPTIVVVVAVVIIISRSRTQSMTLGFLLERWMGSELSPAPAPHFLIGSLQHLGGFWEQCD